MKNNKPNCIVVDDIDDQRVLTPKDLDTFNFFCALGVTQDYAEYVINSDKTLSKMLEQLGGAPLTDAERKDRWLNYCKVFSIPPENQIF